MFSFVHECYCDMQMLTHIKDCFVTGSWADAEDAAKLLANDGISSSFVLLLLNVFLTMVDKPLMFVAASCSDLIPTTYKCSMVLLTVMVT